MYFELFDSRRYDPMVFLDNLYQHTLSLSLSFSLYVFTFVFERILVSLSGAIHRRGQNGITAFEVEECFAFGFVTESEEPQSIASAWGIVWSIFGIFITNAYLFWYCCACGT